MAKTVETIPGTEAVAIRLVNAENYLIELLVELGGLSEAEAEVAAAVLKKAKVIKRNVAHGRYDFKHGAFAERAVIRCAAGVAGD